MFNEKAMIGQNIFKFIKANKKGDVNYEKGFDHF